MKKHFPIIIEQDKDGVFIVESPVLKGCRSYGRTVDEALENIREAIEVCLMDETPDLDKSMTFVGLPTSNWRYDDWVFPQYRFGFLSKRSNDLVLCQFAKKGHIFVLSILMAVRQQSRIMEIKMCLMGFC